MEILGEKTKIAILLSLKIVGYFTKIRLNRRLDQNKMYHSKTTEISFFFQEEHKNLVKFLIYDIRYVSLKIPRLSRSDNTFLPQFSYIRCKKTLK